MILTNPHQLSYTPKRIISLVPSQTELLHYLGLEEEIIAITKFCVHPGNWFKNKTRIGGTKALDMEKIISLKPDLIIANKEENVQEQVEKLADNFPVWVTDVDDLTAAYRMISDIGLLTKKENEASGLIDLIKIKFDYVYQISNTNKRISVAYLIWKNPYMTVGGDTFISSMLETAGLMNVFSNETRYPEITLSQLKTMNLPTGQAGLPSGQAGCELVFLSSEPYPFIQKDIVELQKELPGIQIMLVDGEMFSWYGSRLLESPDYFIKLRSGYQVSGT